MSEEVRPPGAILLTGSAGFIAGHVTRLLNQRFPNRRVVGLDIAETPASRCAVAVRGDLLDCDIASVIREQGVTHIVHLAALCKEPGFPWRDYFRVNAQGTDRLIDAASDCGVRSIVFTSTMMVFAAGPSRRAEDDLCDPDTAYGMSKLLAERSLLQWQSSAPRRRLSIIRPGVVFGPGDYGNMTRLVHAVRRRSFAFMGRSDTKKGCIYVTDLAELIVSSLAAGESSEILHAVYPEETSIRDIVQAIADAWGIRRSPPTVPYGLALALASIVALFDPLGRRFAIHPRRIQKLYNDTNISTKRLVSRGWKPQFTLEDAFRDWRARQ
ncbi:MAG: NAD-dependent epimerase/dehydratase family protein [Gemmatimonadaceae bacterium]|nr:NAD-dependent epimerase/dehydratase family protein [Gemmatimonadaceae bacterium]